MIRRDPSGLLLAVLIGAGSALAQAPDPTRPAGAMMPSGAASGAAAGVESGVRTVILRPHGKSAAVINGQYVVVGGKLGDMRVIRISENEVVLRGKNGREVLKVTPAIEKVPTSKAAAGKRRTTGITGK